MSRSKHTVPPRIRGPWRVRAPYAARGAGDPSGRNRTGRSLKLLGVLPIPKAPAPADGPPPLPRLIARRPRPGYLHPAGRAEVTRILRWLGPAYTYGLRSIELVQGSAVPPGRPLPLGQLLVPGRVQLFDQPVPPWVLPGLLSARQAARLRAAGAVVEQLGGVQTVVSWPGRALADFMLFEVLAHEIAHHLVQQYTGKRLARVARTRDHEAFAEHFAERCRRLYRAGQPAPDPCRPS